jgi:hypothetical protein
LKTWRLPFYADLDAGKTLGKTKCQAWPRFVGCSAYVKKLIKPIYDATQYKHFSGETEPLKVIFLHPFRSLDRSTQNVSSLRHHNVIHLLFGKPPFPVISCAAPFSIFQPGEEP